MKCNCKVNKGKPIISIKQTKIKELEKRVVELEGTILKMKSRQDSIPPTDIPDKILMSWFPC